MLPRSPLNPRELPERATIIAPRKYGNAYFDMMEVPLEMWPAETLVLLDPFTQYEKLVSIPTADIFVAGDFLARRYAAVTFTAIKNVLRANGEYPQTFRVMNDPHVRPDPSYTQAELSAR